MTAAPETIGQRVKRERLELGWTQRYLAAAVDVGVPHISKVEADRESPSDDLLRRFATVFAVDVDELLLVARRVPETMLDVFAADPAKALALFRRMEAKSS